MEEQALNVTSKALRKGLCIAILDLESKKVETSLLFPTTFLFPFYLKILKTEVGRELYIFMSHEVASTFGFPFIGEVSTTHP